jgi:hypothetical protein
LVLFFRDPQRRASHMDGDTMMLETVEEGIDQGFTLEESVPVGIHEVSGHDLGGNSHILPRRPCFVRSAIVSLFISAATQ